MLIILTSIAAIAGADLLTPLAVVGGVLYVIPVYLTTRLPLSGARQPRNIYAVAVTCTLLTLTGFVLSPRVGALMWVAIINHSIAIVAILAISALALNQARLVAENAELRELIRICSYCKRVVNEDGKWQAIDYYFHRQTGVDFTHGMCPTCLERYLEDVRKESPASV